MVPTSLPFNFHWYEGDAPPLVGVAVKVTDVPAQIAPDGDAAIATEGVTFAFTVIVIVLDVAVAGLAHGLFDVITQLTWSLFTNVALV